MHNTGFSFVLSLIPSLKPNEHGASSNLFDGFVHLSLPAKIGLDVTAEELEILFLGILL